MNPKFNAPRDMQNAGTLEGPGVLKVRIGLDAHRAARPQPGERVDHPLLRCPVKPPLDQPLVCTRSVRCVL